MPKASQYRKGSVVYLSGDRDERIFILQHGVVFLSSFDIETNAPVKEQIKTGEFFGVKSALAHFPREETAEVVADSILISMSVEEFETIFSKNKQVVMKMLRSFSGQLRKINKQTESILSTNATVNQAQGMLSVAKSFYADEQYRACSDICLKYLKHYPDTEDKPTIAKLYSDSKTRYQKLLASGRTKPPKTLSTDSKPLKQFMLPAFDRFSKKYDDEQVIISEFEPGDCFYLIQSGEVQVVKCVNGIKKNLDILKAGEFFGEMAILDNSPRSATCLAVGPVECLEFNKANFEVLVTGNPQIALLLIKIFSKRIYDQKRRFKILTIKNLQARIADVFCMYDEITPVTNVNDRSRRFNITLSDISHWAGLPQQTTQDEMNKLMEQGKIEVFTNYIIVKNMRDMKRLADADYINSTGR